MNRQDDIQASRLGQHDFLIDHDDPLIAKQLLESNFNFERTIKPLPRKHDYSISASVNQTHHNQRRRKLFEKLEDHSPARNTEFILYRKGNIEFKVPSIKQYYIPEQQNLECNLRMTTGFRIPSLDEQEVQDSPYLKKESNKPKTDAPRHSIKKEKKKHSQRNKVTTFFQIIAFVLVLMGGILLADYHYKIINL